MQSRNMTCIVIKQQIVVPSLSKKATWNKFLLLPRLILSNPAGNFFFFTALLNLIKEDFCLCGSGAHAPVKNLAITKNDAQNCLVSK